MWSRKVIAVCVESVHAGVAELCVPVCSLQAFIGAGVMVLDIFDFARRGALLEGQTALADFARLLDGLPEQNSRAQVDWRVSGSVNGQGQMFLHVQAAACPDLVCQRCLGPVAWPVRVDTRVQLEVSESQLDTDDGTDDSPERILGSTRFDLVSLVEDELILELPYVPRHEQCPEHHESQDASAEGSSSGKPSPFAVLDQLRTK